MKKISQGILMMLLATGAVAQDLNKTLLDFTVIKNNAATPVKNQGETGTCWCFSSTSVVESECLRKGLPALDLSEMYIVRNIYLEKAKNYIHRQGFTRFDEGGLAHDFLHAAAIYGLMPENVYSGLKDGRTSHNHGPMVEEMKNYLDSLLKVKRPLPDNWTVRVNSILDNYLGTVPASFTYNGKTYTPVTFAKEVVKFSQDDYVNLTSFTDHPYYAPFIVQVPDNYSNGAYYNLPLEELVNVAKATVNKGYTVLWDTDMSNRGWVLGKGYGLYPAEDSLLKKVPFNPDMSEKAYNAADRQRLYEELVTEDDHLMQITGLGKSAGGKEFFIVKNSWGPKAGPFDGYMHVSIPYFAMNTITMVVPKAVLDKAMLGKLALK
ncbi:C1 family peptidase [Chitinophaga sp.]|uniref:C1 family peptidase n=1 Tax=Chitinophaga sp. TaxID=1869181 RepID=UPI0031E05796